MVVKNEEKWVWFSIISIIDYVDKVIVFDTGSKDSTRDILNTLKAIYPEKMQLTFFDRFPEKDLAYLRQLQIEMTGTEWFMVLDGDEIWPKESIESIVNLLPVTNASLVAVPFINFVGNLNNIQNPAVNTYRLKDVTGSFTLRFIRTKYRNVRASGIYGVEGYYDNSGEPIQSHEEDLILLDKGFQHTSLLIRSKNLIYDFTIKYRRKKFLAKAAYVRDFDLADVFLHKNIPPIVPDPFTTPGFIMKYWYKFYCNVVW